MQPVKMTITLGPQGLQLAASTEDRCVLYGLLEMAKDAVRQHQPKAAGIEVATGDMAKALTANGVGH